MNYLIMLIAGMIGIFLFALRKVKGIRKRVPEADYKTVFNQYWKSEWDTITTSVIVVIACIFISSEYLNIDSDTEAPAGIGGIVKFKIATFIRTTFIVIGYSANSIVDAFLGTTEAILQKKAKAGGVLPEQETKP